MIKRKILIYQKNIHKPIMITDTSDDTDQQFDQIIRNCFESSSIITLENGIDKLYIRPSEVTSILITKDSEINNNTNTKYDDVLKLDDTNVKE